MAIMHPTLHLLWVMTVTLSATSSATIDPSCDYHEQMKLGQEYYLYNPEYPARSRKSCRWTGESPQGTTIVFSCNEVNLPYSRDCLGDVLAFSPDGQADLDYAERYCGNTSFAAYTYGNRFVLTLDVNARGTGGQFLCSVAVMRVASSCNCGFKSQMKIVGGTETGINEFPSMSGLFDYETEYLYCGASIISDRYAVTASHCLLNKAPSQLRLAVGEHDTSKPDDSPYADLIPVESFQSHPYYDSGSQHNDIAVVRTSRTIQFNMAVNTICLPFIYREFNFLHETVTALGWGFQDFSGNKSDVLLKVDVSVVSNQDCDAALAESIDFTQICTYADGKDACISDSGGPVIWRDSYSGKLELVGIISFGMGCATNKPAVNTRVSAYLSWVVSVTPDAAFCIQ